MSVTLYRNCKIHVVLLVVT